MATAGLAGASPVWSQTAAVRSETCPASLPEGTRCWSGRAESGAWWWYARPADWNGRLILHAHGGPRLGDPQRAEPAEDLERFSVMVAEGYAWAGSSYRRGGYGVRMAAEDTDQLRQIVWEHWGRPERTLLHGQSWGANVAAKAAELHGRDADGAPVYDGILLTNGVVNGGTRAYQFRADLRAVYQYFCRNHPAPSDPAYPVWQGLPAGATMTRAELRRRVGVCTGIGLSARDRTAAQSRAKRQILAVTRLKEEELISHLNWATFTFQDLVHLRLGGRNPFDNSTRVYSGSDDDAALNAGVERFSADPEAVAMLAHDADLTGDLPAPTLTVHALHDPTVFHSAQAVYAETVRAAGRSELLVQATTSESDHSKLENSTYVTALDRLETWIDSGHRPDPARFQSHCATLKLANCSFLDR